MSTGPYTGVVINNMAKVDIPKDILQNLNNGKSYTVIANVSNKGIAATPFTSASFEVDTTKPTMNITSTTVTSGTTTNDLSIAITLTTEAGTTFEQADITLVNGTLSAIAGYGPYTAIFTPTANTTGSISVAAGTFQDAYGNPNTVSNTFTWTQDIILPTMDITSTSVADGATTTQALIAINFATEAGTTFEQADITLVNGTLSAITGSGKVYYATFTPTDDGVCTIDVAANKFTDAYGNPNKASNIFTWTFDGTVIINGTGVFTKESWTGAVGPNAETGPPAFEIGPGFTSVGDNALNGQTTITQVIIGNGVTSIDSAAFANCSNLTSVTFSSGSALQTIGSSAFSLSGLTGSIAIPKSVTSIGAQAFQNCSSLTSVTFDQDSALTTIGDFAFTSVAMNEITIPASVTSIGTQAFYGCSSLTTITFNQDSVLTTIGTYAFYSCTALSTITIPKLVTSIGTYTFYECSNLTSVSFAPNSALTTIGEIAFYNCSAITGPITIPDW